MPEVASLLGDRGGKQVTGLAVGEVNVQNACAWLSSATSNSMQLFRGLVY